MLIGAHVSCSGGLEKGIDRARDIGAEAIQIFSSAPQSWRPDNHSDESVARFRERAAACGIDDVFIHAIYLINLAAESPEQLGRSVGSLKLALKTSSRIGARGVIFHVGSHKGAGFTDVLTQILTAVDDVLASTPDDSWLILENSAGMGGSIGSDFAELGTILNESGNDRLKVCLDTCHTLAAGYEIRTQPGLAETMDRFDHEVGIERLVAVHAND
ncbi:MAG TPA: deoxyribonuclease IV, partial [Dehalococcoidia bacterium]|nr:deoxyribonuclease IV [Dehalococcoidia bacterium]